jgi:hypothetical protein
MTGEPGNRPSGIDRDLSMIFTETEALRSLTSDPNEAKDGSRVYDLSIRWGVLMSGRLKRLEHYYRAGEPMEYQKQRYRELRRELEASMLLVERLGISPPSVPLED